MSDKIKIKNYGPLEIGTTELDGGSLIVPKFTFFIGDQGTGKSTTAKLISTLSWTEKAMVRKTIDPKSLSFETLAGLLLNQNLPKDYFTNATVIEYSGKAYTISISDKTVKVTANSEASDYLCPKIMYYPSERNILSVMDNPWDVRGFPEMVVALASEYLNAQMSGGRRSKAFFNDYRVDFDSVSRQSFVQDPGKKTRIPLSYASSGLQSVAPLMVVSDYLTKKLHADLFDRMRNESIGTRTRIIEAVNDDELKEKLRSFFSSTIKDVFTEEDLNELRAVAERFVNTTLLQIVEEPEQNLYPTSQVSAIRKLIQNTNSIGRLIVTTHSPYILSAVNNFILAYDLRDNIKKCPKGITKDEFIRYEDVSAYKIKDGRVFSILDDDARMIDATEIDECSIDINRLFDNLMDIRESVDEGQ